MAKTKTIPNPEVIHTPSVGFGTANLATRTLYLIGEISSETLPQVLGAIDLLGVSPFMVKLCTNGGSQEAGFGIADALVSHGKATVITTGACMSAGALILGAGRTRLSMPNTRFMVHPTSLELAAEQGFDNKDMKMMAAELSFATTQYIDFLMRKVTITRSVLEEMCEKETYFTPEQALGWGFIDGIVGVR